MTCQAVDTAARAHVQCVLVSGCGQVLQQQGAEGRRLGELGAAWRCMCLHTTNYKVGAMPSAMDAAAVTVTIS